MQFADVFIHIDKQGEGVRQRAAEFQHNIILNGKLTAFSQ